MNDLAEIVEHLSVRYGDAMTVTTHHDEPLHRHMLVTHHDEETK
ncbi:hypothetical protein [Gordonia polyisoprenivorans]